MRPRVCGKFICLGEEKLYVRGVTYGTFEPRASGEEYPEPEIVEQDFSMMAANGFNAIRTYTPPPRWLLDTAHRHRLHVMVGLALERYAGYLADRKGVPDPLEIARDGVRECAGHPAVLFYAVGNEIPASVVRWNGRRKVERFLHKLYQVAKSEDPGGLVSYVNYPSTEYLDLPFLDLVCFNVYLEAQDRLEAYLPRLQTIAGDRPLIMSEVGLDSLRNGLDKQAQVLEWQVKTAYRAGCAGCFVYAWTDEWYRSGEDVRDWHFGLTTRSRQPKPALAAASRAYGEAPFPPSHDWPTVSVVVCTYNGGRTLPDTLEGLRQLTYPNYEVIIVDNGSSDRLTSEIAQRSGHKVIRTPRSGLSAARNAGMREATGEIIAYIDDDARPDPHWLHYLVESMLASNRCGVGGPNLPPPGDGPVAECVASAPGNPVHVLLTDEVAEHIPGCNMAFRKSCLEAVGGFDPQFRVAGDDVDVCWRLQAIGCTIGFSPAATVWHHRRNSVSAYLRQQVGYGRAEGLLERKWPEKYNAAGHITWSGRVYDKGLVSLSYWSSRVYHGVWGLAPFQSIYGPPQDAFSSLPFLPEWFFIAFCLAILAFLGLSWRPLLFISLPLFLVATSISILQAGFGASRARFSEQPANRFEVAKMRLLTGFLFLAQPLARLYGRTKHGLTPLRWRWSLRLTAPWPQSIAHWFEHWQSAEVRLETIEKRLREIGAIVLRGGDFDRWDLEVHGGMLGRARMIMSVEEFAGGQQLVRYRLWPHCSTGTLVFALAWPFLSILASFDGALIAGLTLGVLGSIIVLRMLFESAASMASIKSMLQVTEPAATEADS